MTDNTLNDALAPVVLQALWQRSLYGIAAIDNEGRVIAVNPTFERCTGLDQAAVIGLTEDDFNLAILATPVRECNRVDVAVEGLRALYYLRVRSGSTPQNTMAIKLAHIAEALREPLASIYGFSELLLTQDYDEETRIDLTSTLLDQVEVMSNLINEQLDVRKIDK